MDAKQAKLLKERQAAALRNEGGSVRKRSNKDGLSAEDELFCQTFAGDSERFGNGTRSYIEAYSIIVTDRPNKNNPKEKTMGACKVAAHERLTNPNFLKRINEIFEGGGLNDAFVDKQLEKVITQDAEFAPKVQAIREYNKLKKRITDHVLHTFENDARSDSEIEKRIQELESFYKKTPKK